MRTILACALIVASLVPLGPSAASDSPTVSAFNGFWDPDEVTIAPGGSVNFVLAEGTHTWELSDGGDACTLPCTRAFPDEGAVNYRCGIHLSMTGVVLVGSPPVVGFTTPAPGATVSGNLHVEGTASHASGIEDVTVGFEGGSTVLATLSGLAWSADVPTTSVANGAQTLVATATSVSGIASAALLAVVVDNPITLDLELVAAGAAPMGTLTNVITFSVKNNGNDLSGEVDVLLEYFYHGTWRVIGTAELGRIPMGATEGGSFTWRPASPHVGAFDVRLTVDPDATMPDPDRADNVRVVTAGFFTTAVPGIVATEPV